MSRAAMQQALAYIEEVDYGPYDKWPVIIALKQALAEPEQPHDLLCVCGAEWDIYSDGREELVTAPTPRKPLTDGEIWNTYKNLWMFHPAEEPRLAGDVLKFARAIERAHGIGEQHGS